jgi:hypothetical protein
MLGIFMTHFLACAIQLDCFVAALLAMTSKDVVIILKKRQLCIAPDSLDTRQG